MTEMCEECNRLKQVVLQYQRQISILREVLNREGYSDYKINKLLQLKELRKE